MESSRRNLLNDVAQHRPIVENNQNTHQPRFGFTPKTGIASSKTGFVFTVMHFASLRLKILTRVKIYPHLISLNREFFDGDVILPFHAVSAIHPLLWIT